MKNKKFSLTAMSASLALAILLNLAATAGAGRMELIRRARSRLTHRATSMAQLPTVDTAAPRMAVA